MIKIIAEVTPKLTTDKEQEYEVNIVETCICRSCGFGIPLNSTLHVPDGTIDVTTRYCPLCGTKL